MARDAVAFIRALGFDQVDLLGFSMGGMVAQVIAQQQPQLVRKMILAGTGPAGGEGIDKVTRITYLDTARALLTRQDPKQFLFFTRRERAPGRQAVPGPADRNVPPTATRPSPCARSAPSSRPSTAGVSSSRRISRASISRCSSLNGDNDRMVPTKNSVDLARRLPNSQLVIYPDAGHGGIFQYHEDFVKRALEFLATGDTVMKAFVVEKYGKDGLRAADVPEPDRRRR